MDRMEAQTTLHRLPPKRVLVQPAPSLVSARGRPRTSTRTRSTIVVRSPSNSPPKCLIVPEIDTLEEKYGIEVGSQMRSRGFTEDLLALASGRTRVLCIRENYSTLCMRPRIADRIGDNIEQNAAVTLARPSLARHKDLRIRGVVLDKPALTPRFEIQHE